MQAIIVDGQDIVDIDSGAVIAGEIEQIRTRRLHFHLPGPSGSKSVLEAKGLKLVVIQIENLRFDDSLGLAQGRKIGEILNFVRHVLRQHPVFAHPQSSGRLLWFTAWFVLL